MGAFTYSAIESLLPNRVLGESVTLEIDTQDTTRSRKPEKDVQVSLGGAMEVIKHRADVTWSIVFEPVSGGKLLLVREFLDSTEGGEPFSMDLDGQPTVVKRVDEGYTEQPYLRVGSSSTDWFTISPIQVIEL